MQIQQVIGDFSFAAPQSGSKDSTPQLDQLAIAYSTSSPSTTLVDGPTDGSATKEVTQYDSHLMTQKFGVPCMVEVLHFLCSLLNITEHVDQVRKSNSLAFD